jgi:hypothetical protein
MMIFGEIFDCFLVLKLYFFGTCGYGCAFWVRALGRWVGVGGWGGWGAGGAGWDFGNMNMFVQSISFMVCSLN